MFNGFRPEAIDFLWGIRMNNERGWFQEHKQQYITEVYEPMKALGDELFELFRDRPGEQLKVSRIYRDARLHHPDPYKDSIWLCIRRDMAYWAETPCLFLEICPEGVTYGFSIWKPKTACMADFRSRLSAGPDEFLEMLRTIEEHTGHRVQAACYKRPRSTPEDPRLTEYFSWKDDISCICREEVSESLYGPELAGRAAAFLRELIPLYDYFNLICSAETA